MSSPNVVPYPVQFRPLVEKYRERWEGCPDDEWEPLAEWFGVQTAQILRLAGRAEAADWLDSALQERPYE